MGDTELDERTSLAIAAAREIGYVPCVSALVQQETAAWPAAEPDAYRLATEAFGDVAASFAHDGSLDELLELVADRICRLLGVDRCSVYLRKEHSELFRGRLTHVVGHRGDVASRQLTAGVPADRFTQEILATRRPVIARDASNDPRLVRSVMREWDVHTLLGVPMLFAGDMRGVMFLDSSDRPHDYTPFQQHVAAIFANLAAVAVVQAQTAAELRETSAAADRQNALLRRVTKATTELAHVIGDGANAADVAAAIADIARKQCWIYDAQRRRLGLGGLGDTEAGELITPLDDGPVSDVRVTALLREGRRGRPLVIGPLPELGLTRPFVVATIATRDRPWGHVVIRGARVGTFEKLLASRAASLLSIQFSGAWRAAGEEALARDLVGGAADASALTQRASALGIDLAVGHVVCLLQGAVRPAADEVAMAFSGMLEGSRALSTATPHGTVVIVEGRPSAAKELVRRAGRLLFAEGGFAAALVGASGAPDHYADAYCAATSLLRQARPGNDVLASDDVGMEPLVGPLAADGTARALARQSLEPLLHGVGGAETMLIETLRAFVAESFSVRRTAEGLGVHINTVRYRLARIAELTGLDLVARPMDRLSVYLALRILEGEQPLSRP
jgi:sugar diacid utilization regulator